MLSGNSAIHQFGAVGKLALLSGCATATKDVPPFSISCNRNEFAGVNIVGMRRAGYDGATINAVRKAYRTIYFKGLTIKYAVAMIEQEMGHIEAIADPGPLRPHYQARHRRQLPDGQGHRGGGSGVIAFRI